MSAQTWRISEQTNVPSVDRRVQKLEKLLFAKVRLRLAGRVKNSTGQNPAFFLKTGRLTPRYRTIEKYR
jgi:hypothetical protein